MFVHSSGDALDAAGETALQDYVQNGGGFVGMGETALLEQGGAAFFNTLTGLSGHAHHRHRHLERRGRRVPRPRAPVDARAAAGRQGPGPRPGTRGPANPTGTVHTVARVRGNALPDGTSVPNDAVSRFTGGTATIQPQLERPASWCPDLQQGRSFYTELGSSAASVGER